MKATPRPRGWGRDLVDPDAGDRFTRVTLLDRSLEAAKARRAAALAVATDEVEPDEGRGHSPVELDW